MESIVERVKLLIKDLEIPEKDLYKRIGMGQRTVSYYLNGERKPNLEFVTKIVNTFPNTNSGWLITGNGERFKAENAVKIFVPEDLPKQVGRLYRAPIYESHPASWCTHNHQASPL